MSQDYNDISFSADRGRLAANSNFNINEVDSVTRTTTQVASSLTSGGNVNIAAKDDINVMSSNLSSNDQINLISDEGNVNILANKDTVSTESEIRKENKSLSAGIGHVAVDAAYAEYDVIQAAKKVKEAKDDLKHMKNLQAQGKATSEAVSDAKDNLKMAGLNFALAEVKLAQSAAKAAESAIALGFYADVKLMKEGSKTNSKFDSSSEVGSNLTASNNVNITSGSDLLALPPTAINEDQGNTNIKGNVTSNDGDVNITSANDTNIEALESTTTSSSKSEGYNTSITLASSTSGSDKAFEAIIQNLSAAISAGSNKSKSDSNSINYTNTTLLAENGELNINSGNDASIKGADLLAEDTTINTVNNLTIESLQNEEHSKSKSSSMNLGGSSGNSVSFGFSKNKSKFDKEWVDDQTSVIGTNSVQINTGENTDIKGALVANITNATKESVTPSLRGETNGNDAANQQSNWVDGENLAINTGTLTTENIIDSEEQKSSGLGIQVSNLSVGSSTTSTGNEAGSGGNGGSGTAGNNAIDSNSNNPNQDKNYYPLGSETITASSSGYEKEQLTKATIGEGTVTLGGTQSFDNLTGNFTGTTGGAIQTNEQLAALNGNDNPDQQLNRDIRDSQEVTKDTITGALDAETTIDNRLIAAIYDQGVRDELIDQQVNLGKNLKKTTDLQGKLLKAGRDLAEDNLGVVGKVITAPTSIAEGAIYTFTEKKDEAGDAKLRIKNLETGEVLIITDPAIVKAYALNGINNTTQDIIDSYFKTTKPNIIVERENPTHGVLGDLVESGLGKIFKSVGLSNVVAMNRIASEDMLARKDVKGGVNLYHSQGTIIAAGAMDIYKNEYMQPILTYNSPDGNGGWAGAGGTQTLTYTNQIDPSQVFVAVGPAESKNSWKSVVGGLNLNTEDDSRLLNYAYSHDDRDPVRYLTAPKNPLDFGVGLKLIGQDIGNAMIGNTADSNFSHHSVTNPLYLPKYVGNQNSNNVNP